MAAPVLAARRCFATAYPVVSGGGDVGVEAASVRRIDLVLAINKAVL